MSNGRSPAPSVLQSVAQDLRLLLAQTLRLARTEATRTARSTGMYLGMALVGVGAALVGILVLVSALVLTLIAFGLPPWAAALIIALLLLVGGGSTAYVCMVSLANVEFGLPQTRRSVRETMKWLNTQLQ